MIRGLNHVTFAVAELDSALAFYAGLLGCRLLARWPRGVYLLAGNLWLALIADEQARDAVPADYTHLALDVAPADFDAFSRRLLAAGVRVWKQNRSEGPSLYLLDPDGHKLELHAGDWRSRLRAAQAAPWEGLEIFVDPEDAK